MLWTLMKRQLLVMLQVQEVVVEDVLIVQEQEKRSKRNAMVQKEIRLNQLRGEMIRNLMIVISQRTHHRLSR